MVLCLKIYLEKACSSDIWKYCPDLFSFWDIENVKPKFQPRYAYKLYAYKKECMKCEKKPWLLPKLIFETFLPNSFPNLPPIRKKNFPKGLFQFAKMYSAILPEN